MNLQPRSTAMEGHLYSLNILSVLLLPLSAIYWLLQSVHKILYRSGVLRTRRVDVPVIVLGNITVGGTGKTPLVQWMAGYLKTNGYHPGIISRGYGGSNSQPTCVTSGADPSVFGDEPVLLAESTGVPVYVGTNRIEAARLLLNENACDVLISDDGLQHYRLHRDIEIAVIDGWRRFGNGFLLPSGPLRESTKRLGTVDWVLCRGSTPSASEIPYRYRPVSVVNFKTGETHDVGYLAGKRIHAVTGIGNPDQFFEQLKSLGYELEKHAYPDHHYFSPEELTFPDARPVIMTEKDAVKCQHLINEIPSDIYVLVIQVELPDSFGKELIEKLRGIQSHGSKTA